MTLFARWLPYAPQRIFMRPHDMSWARHSHLPVRERSPDIPLDGVMHDGAYPLRRISILGSRVNKGQNKGRSPLRRTSTHILSA